MDEPIDPVTEAQSLRAYLEQNAATLPDEERREIEARLAELEACAGD